MSLVLVRCCAGLLMLACVFAMGGCSADALDGIVLPATQTNPDRQPPAGAVRVDVLNQSDFLADVQVDCFIGSTAVHHAEAVLAPELSSDPNTDLHLGWDEADQVVVQVQVKDAAGQTLWSDQKTYWLGTDFMDQESIEYTIIYPLDAHTPVAVIQATSTAMSGRLVTLDGMYSHDPDGDPLTYTWQQVGGPTVSLADAGTPIASFAVPAVSGPTSFTFRLTVSDGQLSGSDEVTITVQANQAPVAVASGPSQAATGNSITLDGTSSHDPDGDSLTYTWEQISGTPVTLSNATQAIATFTAPVVSVSDTLVFRLTVSDGSLSSAQQVDIVIVSPG